MPAEVVLAAVVSLDPPVDCAFALLVSDSWFGGTAAARPLAFRGISEGCDISLVSTLSLSSFGGPGHPLDMATIGDHDGGLSFSNFNLPSPMQGKKLYTPRALIFYSVLLGACLSSVLVVNFRRI
jgi:hypothetical protein